MSGIRSQHSTSTETMSVSQNTVFAPIIKRRKEETKLEAGCLPRFHHNLQDQASEWPSLHPQP